MKKSWLVSVLFATYSLAYAGQATAQSVYSYSDFSYYEPTNSVLAYSEAFSDYPAELYYCLEVYGPVYKDGVEQAWISGQNHDPNTGQCGGWATAETYLPYDANAEYEVVAYHQLQTAYRTFNESGYEDYYNFSAYGAEVPMVYSPGYFNFIGGGPSVPSVQYLFLGAVHSMFTGGIRSKPPHHLKILNDVIGQGMCYQKFRETTYKIVDVDGRPAGGVPIMEISPGTIINSCNGQEVEGDSCNLNYIGLLAGNFTDRLTSGCPTLGGNCGFTVDQDKWAWCSRSGPKVLGRIYMDVRYPAINLNGADYPWPPGSEFYP